MFVHHLTLSIYFISKQYILFLIQWTYYSSKHDITYLLNNQEFLDNEFQFTCSMQRFKIAYFFFEYQLKIMAVKLK